MQRMKLVVLAVLVLAFGEPGARALEINVTVDSSAIPNGTAGFLDFQFSAGVPSAQTAQVVVKNFAATSVTPGAITFANSASGGPLPTNVTILNDPAYLSNRAKQAVTYGSASSMSFTLEITGNALTTPSTQDSTFYFSLLDSNDQSIFPSYALPHMTITIPKSGSGDLVITSIPQIVPEPGTLALAAVTIAVLGLTMRHRSRCTRLAA